MPLGSNRIALVVGNETATRGELSSALRGLCSSCEVDNLSAAREFLAKHDPQLLVIDTTRTNAQAIEVAADLRRKSVAPVVVLADPGQEDLAIRALDLRVNAYLRTPLRAADIRTQVRALLAAGPAPDHVVDRLQGHMREMALSAPSYDAISTKMGIPPRRLRRLFLQRFGRTPVQYLRQIRLEHAQHLLMTTDLPVVAIAKQVGFTSGSHFDHAFKEHAGKSPLAFRYDSRASAAAN
jgi:AraC-like DNA-binding protein